MLFLFFSESFSQTNDDKIRLQVLRQNKIGKEYKFYNNKDSTMTYLKYLGQLTSNKKIKYKVLTSVWIWGMSHRATNRILIFDKHNTYLGNYYVTTTSDLPNKIDKNELVFLNKENGCDKSLQTRLSFKDEIPSQFFRKCKDKFGDIYSFSKD